MRVASGFSTKITYEELANWEKLSTSINQAKSYIYK